MSQPTAGAASSVASVLFNLPDYEVLEVTLDEDGGRTVVISTPVTEAANVTIKNIKCTGRGYRSHANYRSRIMLYNAAWWG